ncbi:MAG: LiaF transmembrane domain-containing protein, partial [Bryobacteraceae bacterium]
MRRSSIVGPLLLIVVGALFLMNNLRPDLPLLEVAARYWPFVLIAWGVLRLLEVLYWTVTRKPLPDHGVSGGEWVLIVFLCLAGSGLFFFHNRIGGWPPTQIRMRGIEVFGESFDYPLKEQTIEAGKAPRVVIENFRGNVRVTGSDTSQVIVNGRNTVRALERARADEANEAAVLEMSKQGETVVIRTNQER